MTTTGSGRYGVREFATKHLLWFTDEDEARAFEKKQIALFDEAAAMKAGIVRQKNNFSFTMVKRPSLRDPQGRLAGQDV